MKGPQDILFGSRGYPKAKRAHCRNDGAGGSFLEGQGQGLWEGCCCYSGERSQ